MAGKPDNANADRDFYGWVRTGSPDLDRDNRLDDSDPVFKMFWSAQIPPDYAGAIRVMDADGNIARSVPSMYGDDGLLRDGFSLVKRDEDTGQYVDIDLGEIELRGYKADDFDIVTWNGDVVEPHPETGLYASQYFNAGSGGVAYGYALKPKEGVDIAPSLLDTKGHVDPDAFKVRMAWTADIDGMETRFFPESEGYAYVYYESEVAPAAEVAPTPLESETLAPISLREEWENAVHAPLVQATHGMDYGAANADGSIGRPAMDDAAPAKIEQEVPEEQTGWDGVVREVDGLIVIPGEYKSRVPDDWGQLVDQQPAPVAREPEKDQETEVFTQDVREMDINNIKTGEPVTDLSAMPYAKEWFANISKNAQSGDLKNVSPEDLGALTQDLNGVVSMFEGDPDMGLEALNDAFRDVAAANPDSAGTVAIAASIYFGSADFSGGPDALSSAIDHSLMLADHVNNAQAPEPDSRFGVDGPAQTIENPDQGLVNPGFH